MYSHFYCCLFCPHSNINQLYSSLFYSVQGSRSVLSHLFLLILPLFGDNDGDSFSFLFGFSSSILHANSFQSLEYNIQHVYKKRS